MAKTPHDDDEDDELSDFDLSESEDNDFSLFSEDEELFDEENDDQQPEELKEIETQDDVTIQESNLDDFESDNESQNEEANIEGSSQETVQENNEKNLPNEIADQLPAQPLPISPQQVPILVTIEIGRLHIPLNELLALEKGNMLDLGVRPEDGVNLIVNGKSVGKAELIKIGGILGVRILELGQ